MILSKNVLLTLFATIFFMFVAVIIIAPSSYAVDGGIGDGGEAGGCTDPVNMPCTTNGYGWYKFSSTESLNLEFGLNYNNSKYKNWAAAQKACSDAGADSIVAFIIMRGDKNPDNAGVFNYTTGNYPDKATGHDPDDNNWITNATASTYYTGLPAEFKDATNYEFGKTVAWFCYNFSNEWSITGRSRVYIDKSNSGPVILSKSGSGNVKAVPGNTIYWYHDLYNNGPDSISRPIVYEANVTVGDTENPGNTIPGWNIIKSTKSYGLANSYFVKLYANYSNAPQKSAYKLTQNDVGRNICSYIMWKPTKWNDPVVTNYTYSNYTCVNIPYVYSLTPEITNISDNTMVESLAGSQDIIGRVSNNNITKSHTNIQWQITQVKYAPGVSITNKAGGISPNNPCAYFTGNKTCSALSSGVEAGGYLNGTNKSYPANGNLGDEPVGTKLCYAMSIKRNSSSSTDWGHSKLYCLVVGKKPKVQIYGGDLIVGRAYKSDGTKISSDVITSSSQKDAIHYGSWAEYGIAASGNVIGMASASGYAGGVATNKLCEGLSLLTFNNASASGSNPNVFSCSETNMGKYSISSASIISAIGSRFNTTEMIDGNIDVSKLKPSVIYNRNNNTGVIHVTSSNPLGKGQWVVINAPEASVRIESNLNYTTEPLQKISDIPQLVIIAKDITIDHDVTNIDAWLFAKGSGPDVKDGIINTCSINGVSMPDNLNSSRCDKPLTINGPVIANHLYLYRTAGSGVGAASGDPAEIFNFRPDAYMWASQYAGSNSKARTVMVTELPPRF